MLENTGRNNLLRSLFRNLQGIPRVLLKVLSLVFFFGKVWIWIRHHEIVFGPELDREAF